MAGRVPKSAAAAMPNLGRSAGRRRAINEGYQQLAERIRTEPLMSNQDLAKLRAEMRQHVKDAREEEGWIAPIDREWITAQVERAEKAAEAIHGGRPRRITPPRPAEQAGTKH